MLLCILSLSPSVLHARVSAVISKASRTRAPGQRRAALKWRDLFSILSFSMGHRATVQVRQNIDAGARTRPILAQTIDRHWALGAIMDTRGLRRAEWRGNQGV